MKQIFLVVLFTALFYSLSVAQSIDTRLNTKYSNEYLQDLAQNSPNELKYLNWCLDNSFTIIEVLPEKTGGLPVLNFIDPQTKALCGTVESFDPDNINIYLFSFERKYDKPTTYLIGSTGYAIVFDSSKKVAENYNKYQYGK
jgi:hypothetical protein